MNLSGPSHGQRVVVARQDLDPLVDQLRQMGYHVIGPQLRDKAVSYGEIDGLEDLPAGWGDEQEAGRYRLIERGDDALFAYQLGCNSWKQWFFPPRLKLYEARQVSDTFEIIASDASTPSYALLGVRACELQAIAVQDRVFEQQAFADSHYVGSRQQSFIIAVDCTRAGATCFCASMGAGPEVNGSFDLALTELLYEGEHLFVVRSGSDQGDAVLGRLNWREPRASELGEADRLLAQAEANMGRSMETAELVQQLNQNREHPHWRDLAERCLACANCTMVCPTCFCSSVGEESTLDGKQTARWRRWDSCFNTEFSYTHGGSVRSSTESKYRQWLTHKLAAWTEQFDVSGCVGCGRCITWCPVGIDITEAVRVLQTVEFD